MTLQLSLVLETLRWLCASLSLFWLFSVLPTCVEFACHFSALLVFQYVCVGVYTHVSLQPCAFHPGKGYLGSSALPSKGLHTSPPSRIFSFTGKHAHGYHLCADMKWTLATPVL